MNISKDSITRSEQVEAESDNTESHEIHKLDAK
jgi:hypothetical protein